MARSGQRENRFEGWGRWAIPLTALLLFGATARGYGIFRDELYYIACGKHLDWGYVDHPPLVALIAWAARHVAGDSWIVLRIVSALALTGTVLLVGDTARTMGGGRWAGLMAQLLAAVAPIYLSLFSIYSMNAFDVLIWAGLARIASAALAGGSPRLWVAFGALAGIGLENKVDVVMLGAGLGLGIVISRRFDILRERWIWIGGAVAALLFAPHILWQVAHGWPTREFVANAQRHKITVLGPVGFVARQFQMGGPVGFTFALAGMGWLLFARAARPFRALGWAALVVLVLFAASVSKAYYFAPGLTLLFPAAGVALEAWTAGRFRRPARAVALIAAASILIVAPVIKPLLSEDRFVRYAAALGVAPGSDENHRLGRLPQFFADMHGWEEMTRSVATVYAELAPDERAKACIYGQNYGEAGAIDYFGPALGLPRAMSGHNSYWLWGPGSCTGAVVLIIGGDRADHIRNFKSVEPGGSFRCADCMPYESDLTIWVARDLKVPLAGAWSGSKHYN